MQENAQDRETRKTGDFSAYEKTMPMLSHRWDCGFIDRFTSYLGQRNPFSHPVVDGEHAVWLLDSTAWQTRFQHKWKAQITAAYFLKNSGHDFSTVVADIAEKVGVGKGDAAEARIAERVQPFLDSVLPAHTIQVDLGKAGVRKLGPSSREGISNDVVDIPGPRSDGEHLDATAVNFKGATGLCLTFAEPTGWAVISDIDDTIKKTLTSSPTGILKTTFADEPEAIAGMPEFYKHLSQRLNNPPFWYLSASPYNLYPFLRSFREKHYPRGTMLLREASWMTLAGLLTNLTQGTQEYKVDRMQMVHRWFPGRKYICIGDSTQTDPESYGEMYRKYPNWIGGIFIRKVTGVAEMDGSDKNSDDRFKDAFKGVPETVWYVFEDPKELYDRLEMVLAA
jgi:phosphatidate phosphatase APP1